MGFFINRTQTIGLFFEAISTNITGSDALTALLIVTLLMAVAIMFRLPVELSIPFVLPLLLVMMAYSTEALMVGGVMIIYLAIIFVKWMWLN